MVSIQTGWGCTRCWGTVCVQWAQQQYHWSMFAHIPHFCMSTWDFNLYQPCNGRFSSTREWGAGASNLLPPPPLRLGVFDQAKVMFTCLATSVAKTAIRNCACLVGVETVVLYLNQTKDKRSMAQFSSWIGDKCSQTVGDYEKEIYEWNGRPESEGASSSSGG